MEQGPRKYWYNSGVVVKKVEEKRVTPFRFSPLDGGDEGGDGFFSYQVGGAGVSPEGDVRGNPGHQEAESISPKTMVREEKLQSVTEEARQRGFEEGRSEGMKQGHQEGFHKGKEEGFAAGYKEGFKKGLEEGKREGLALSEKRFQGIVERAKESLERLAKARKELQDSLKSYEAELVALAFEIGASIAMKELDERPEGIAEVVQRALEKIGDSSEVVVKLNPKDLQVLQESGELDHQGVELVSSPTIKRGGCVVETEKGVVDATLDTRVREVADSLLKKGEGGDACN